jgi:hypothetical protein
MAIDQTFTFGNTGATAEMHVGNPSGTTGVNPKAPSDAPILAPNAATPAAATPKSGTFAGVKFQIPA